MRQALLFLLAFSAGLAGLHHADNPPPTIEELHAARSAQALTTAQAQVERTRVVVDWIGTR